MNIIKFSFIISLTFSSGFAEESESLEGRFEQDIGTCYINALAKGLEYAMYENGQRMPQAYDKEGKKNLVVRPYDLIQYYGEEKFGVEVDENGKVKDSKQLRSSLDNFKENYKHEQQDLLSSGHSEEAWEILRSSGKKIPFYDKKTAFWNGSDIYSDGGKSTDEAFTSAQKEFGDKKQGITAIQTGKVLPDNNTKPKGELNLEDFSFTNLPLMYSKEVKWGDFVDKSIEQYPKNASEEDKADIDKLRAHKNSELTKIIDKSLEEYSGGMIIGVKSAAIYELTESGELKQSYQDQNGVASDGKHFINLVSKKVINGKTYYALDDSNATYDEHKSKDEGRYKNSPIGTSLIPAEELYRIQDLEQVKPRHISGGVPKDYKLNAHSGYLRSDSSEADSEKGSAITTPR